MSGARAVTLALATLVLCINGFSPARSFHKQHGKLDRSTDSLDVCVTNHTLNVKN